MADALKFPIYFDLEAAVKKAQGDAPRLIRQLQTTVNLKPLAVNLKIPNAGSGSIKEIKQRLREVVNEWNALAETERITGKTTGEHTARARELLNEYVRLKGALKSYARTLQDIDKEADKAVKAQEKLANSTKKTSQEFQSQDGYISRLLKRMAVYAGYSAIGGFLTNVREVTAQFELQRVSLGAIIQDQQKANQLFAEIKSFALTSPLKILDLTKYTKQVAAYGIEANKLFDTTKMLADISVGLGVDLSRLTLFFGQVYATGYLRASEVRQATEAGIPLVDKLAKKLSEANGTLVTAADVMDLISKRAISFEQVEEVFKDMTSAGGEFYNMQVKQSQTLFGMWSKLGDAAALMYDQIGNTSSVNSAMKTTIGLLEKMMRNWQTMGTWIGTLAIGMGTYALALKNASVASNALTISEARRLAITKAQVIATPKLVAAIIGQNAATKLSTTLTKAHTAAMLKQSVATNVLSKAFWGLSAAMLANPWAIALAAVVAAGYAIYQFTTRVETAEERTEKLNTAVASLKNLDDTVKPLVNTYNKLINKTERTAAEEKKLSEVTHELSKRYPGAITAVGDFGNEVDLAAYKLNKLYQAEKNARMETTQSELDKTKQKIEETEAKIESLQKKIAEGGQWRQKQIYVPGAGYQTTGEMELVPWSEEQKRKLLADIDELNGGLIDMRKSAETSEEALEAMKRGITVEALDIERFGSWRKELQSFRKELASGAKIQLFDDSTITQFKSIDDAMQEAAKTYKENTELVERYSNALADMTATAESRAAAEKDLAEAQERQNLALAALTRFGYKPSDFDKSRGGTQSDQRLSILQEMVSTLKQVNKEYDELAKKEGATKALEDTARIYQQTFDNIKALSKQYKFELPDFGVPTDTASLTKYLKAVKDAMAKLPKSDKAVLALQVDIEKLNIDDMQKKIEQKLKELSDKISRTKTAKEFYDKILSQTSSYDIAGSITMSIYGDDGQNLLRDTIEQLQMAFENVDISAAIDLTTGAIDYNMLRKFEKEYSDKLIAGRKDLRDKLISEGEKASAAQVAQWYKDIEKAKDYNQQYVDIVRETQTKIAEIRRSGLDKDREEELVSGMEEKQRKALKKLQLDEFRSSDLYVRLFEDMDSASTTMLQSLKDKLDEMKKTMREDLTPKELKSLTQDIEKLEDVLQQRNPFKTITAGLKGLRQWHKENGSLADAEKKLTDAIAEEDAARKQWEADTLAAAKAQADLNAALQQYQAIAAVKGEDSEEAQTAKANADAKRAEANAAKETARKSEETYNSAVQTKEEAQETVRSWERWVSSMREGLKVFGKIESILTDMTDAANNFMDAFAASDETRQFFDDILGGLNSIVGGAEKAATGMLDAYAGFKSANPMQMIQGGMSAISGLSSIAKGVTDIFYAGRIKKANKEIKKQQQLLEQLEYVYGRLEKAADKVFGVDYLNNYNRQVKNLQAQAQAYQKQAAAERSKGKKADKDKIKEYENAYRETMDEIADMQGKLTEKFTGTTRQDAAREFAQSWLEAKATFASTTDAMQSKYRDMIKNMIIEGAAAKVIDNVLAPMWEQMDDMLAKSDITGAIDYLVNGMDSFMQQADDGMNVLWKALEARGYDMQKLLGDTDTNLTGISRDIASASEESINGLATGIYTQNYYMQQINSNVALLTQHILGNGASVSAYGGVDTTALWNQHLELQRGIYAHTADTAERCERAAIACESMASEIKKVITPKSVGASHSLNVRINS